MVFASLCVMLLATQTGRAQILQPASWSYDLSKFDYQTGDEIDLIFRVDLIPDWYLYSTDFDPDLGPMITTFNFQPDPSYELVREIQPIGAKRKYDSLWKGEISYFMPTAELRQTIRILGSDLKLAGDYAYQVCTDVDGKCIPFQDEFTWVDFVGSSPGPGGPEASVAGVEAMAPEVVLSTPDVETGFLRQRDAYSPYSLLTFMIVAFLAGLAALLTPCVFPMIPMTVTYFSKGADGRGKKGIGKALFYSLCIIVIYTLTGSVLAPFMGAEMANELATNWIPNVIFFLVFVVFGLSFLGLFEINLPNSFVNKMDRKADSGGYGGVFFMAFTLVLVSFSCTGPLVGTILVEAAGGMVIKPILGMFAFSMAFAIPFGLFAIFPGWISNLPKSGGWLNSVKVVLGFLELAFAFKFLSIADQAYHWGILDREIYLAIWIVIFTLIGFYLLGKIRLPNDSDLKIVSIPRLVMAIISFAFVAYLAPGMFGAPLKALAGYLPPMSSHDFAVADILREKRSSPLLGTTGLCSEPKYSHLLYWPHGIQGYFDYQQALGCAREQSKPLFIDFTGHGCVNCREMEARVWSEPEVLERLTGNYVVVALYVDEKTELPESAWYQSSYDGKIKKTIGRQNADFQITRFNNNAQPYYVLLGADEELLVSPGAYNLDIKNFVRFLDEGLAAYRSKNYSDSPQEVASSKRLE